MAYDHAAWLAENLDEHGDLAPPWARFPGIPVGSIGWRMGAGEGWLWSWHSWVKALPADRDTRLAYLRRHPPAPRTWATSVLRVLEPERADDELEEADDGPDERRSAAEAMLVAEGLVADDAAIIAWRLRNDPPAPPWQHHPTPAHAVRYAPRELTFLVRWAVERREGGRLDAWITAGGEAPSAWAPFVDALREGRPPAALPEDRRDQLAVLLAVAGQPPLPWTRDESPEAMEQQFEDPPTYAGAWAEWAMESFDDRATLAAHLAHGPPMPAQWKDAVAEAVGWLL